MLLFTLKQRIKYICCIYVWYTMFCKFSPDLESSLKLGLSVSLSTGVRSCSRAGVLQHTVIFELWYFTARCTVWRRILKDTLPASDAPPASMGWGVRLAVCAEWVWWGQAGCPFALVVLCQSKNVTEAAQSSSVWSLFRCSYLFIFFISNILSVLSVWTFCSETSFLAFTLCGLSQSSWNNVFCKFIARCKK